MLSFLIFDLHSNLFEFLFQHWVFLQFDAVVFSLELSKACAGCAGERSKARRNSQKRVLEIKAGAHYISKKKI